MRTFDSHSHTNSEVSETTREIMVNVYKPKKLQRDQLIGSIRISMNEFLDGQVHQKWYAVQPVDSKREQKEK